MTTKFATKTWNGTLRTTALFGAVDSHHRTPHTGNDITTPGPCLAPFDGVVVRGLDAGDSDGSWGNYFQMVSDDGRFVFSVAHGNANSDTGLRKGDKIVTGAVILKDMGRPTTGRSTGPHYHQTLTDHGRLVDLFDYLGKTWDGTAAPTRAGWDGVSTLYTGNYADDGLIYTIHVGETIWDVATSKGLTLEQVRAWTAALAGSKYANAQLAKSGPGASWWDGSSTYYAGCTFAVADAVTLLVAEDAKVAAAAQATAEAAADAARQAADAAELVNAGAAAVAADAIELHADTLADLAQIAQQTAADELAEAIQRARATLPTIEAATAQALTTDDGTGALSGLLADNPTTRKRAYYSYAGAALVVSFGPDIVTANIIADTAVPTFVAWITLASSILLKIGTAFGFIAASNTATKK